MTAAVCRPFGPADAPACLAIFDSNVPRHFAPEERAQFAAFLVGLPAADRPYLVLSQRDVVLACGGLDIDRPARRAALAWGMVHRTLQGQGFGAVLTKARLGLARGSPDLEYLTLATSQHTVGFYARFGFAEVGATPDGFGPGLDRRDMVLQLR